jgi:FKBP-type peptidyl-prolyl cis-trans isomerase
MFGAMPQYFFKYIFFVFLFAHLVACKQTAKIEAPKGYKKANHSLYFSIDGKGSELLLNLKEGIIIERHITNAFDLEIPFTKQVSVYDTINQIKDSQYQWLLSSLQKIHQHDTVTFVMNANSLEQKLKLTPSIKLSDGEWIYVHLVISQLQANTNKEADSKEENAETLETVKEQENTKKEEVNENKKAHTEVEKKVESKPLEMPPANADEFEKEAFTLRYYLEYTRPDMLKYEVGPGIFIRIINKGKGRNVKFGDIVSIDYVGRFAMNGKKFDDSSLNPEPLDYVLGKPDQLLKGIEKALYKLKEGGRAEVFFTSRYGYGPEGSSTGIVGKYKSLSFVLHLKKIRNK